MIEKLKEMYSGYEHSNFFIECTYEAFKKAGIKDSNVKWFVNRHFQQYKTCDFTIVKRCITHWQNVAFDKLNNFDFLNYNHSMITVMRYKIIAKIMETYDYEWI
jgi:hypothetical protein